MNPLKRQKLDRLTRIHTITKLISESLLTGFAKEDIYRQLKTSNYLDRDILEALEGLVDDVEEWKAIMELRV